MYSFTYAESFPSSQQNRIFTQHGLQFIFVNNVLAGLVEKTACFLLFYRLCTIAQDCDERCNARAAGNEVTSPLYSMAPMDLK